MHFTGAKSLQKEGFLLCVCLYLSVFYNLFIIVPWVALLSVIVALPGYKSETSFFPDTTIKAGTHAEKLPYKLY